MTADIDARKIALRWLAALAIVAALGGCEGLDVEFDEPYNRVDGGPVLEVDWDADYDFPSGVLWVVVKKNSDGSYDCLYDSANEEMIEGVAGYLDPDYGRVARLTALQLHRDAWLASQGMGLPDGGVAAPDAGTDVERVQSILGLDDEEWQELAMFDPEAEHEEVEFDPPGAAPFALYCGLNAPTRSSTREGVSFSDEVQVLRGRTLSNLWGEFEFTPKRGDGRYMVGVYIRRNPLFRPPTYALRSHWVGVGVVDPLRVSVSRNKQADCDDCVELVGRVNRAAASCAWSTELPEGAEELSESEPEGDDATYRLRVSTPVSGSYTARLRCESEDGLTTVVDAYSRELTRNLCDESPCANDGVCSQSFDQVRCDCEGTGFKGPVCGQEVDDCPAENPCQNGGSCVDGRNTYTCDCGDTDFSGDRCQTQVDDCPAENPCQNGGSCVDGAGSYSCDCAAGFSGDTCGVQLCTPTNPCEHGGTCTDGDAGFSCACAEGYEGDTCQTNIDDCPAENPCQNGGSCVDGVGSYTCSCPAGVIGDQCQLQQACPSENPCENGGTCQDGSGESQYTCTCPEGFGGDLCEVQEACPSENPCENGATCLDGNEGESFECFCPEGFRGERCEIRDACHPNNPCQNGGTCQAAAPGGYDCQCPEGYYGADCAFVMPDQGPYCQTDICKWGGTCSEGADDAVCTCTEGNAGTYCTEIAAQAPCDGNPCGLYGTCAESGDSFVCSCSQGWTGERCDRPENGWCDPNPCSNGGVCTDEGTTFSCACAPGYTGPTCGQLESADPCDDFDPCINGTCDGSSGSVVCQCDTGWTGSYCDVPDDFGGGFGDCDPTCVNGYCDDFFVPASCTCDPGWTGPACDIQF